MSTPAGQPLDLPHQIAQMMVMVVPGRLFPPHPFPSEQALGSRFPSVRQLQKWIQSWGLGGIWVQGAPAPEAMLRIQQLQAWAPLPLLVGVNGTVGLAEQFEGTTPFPPPFCLDDLQPLGSLPPETLTEGNPNLPDTTTPPSLPRDVAAAGQLGHFTAREAKAIGLNWLLGLSLEGDPATSRLGSGLGCFGSHPAHIAARVAAYARAAWAEGVLVSAQLSSQQANGRSGWAELGASGLGGLEIEGLDPPFPREQFTGLLIADSRQDPFSQEHPVQPETRLNPDQVLNAVQAGADLVVVDSVEVAVETITQAVVKGQITPERVAISVHRILEAKARIHPGSRVLLRQYWPALAEQEIIAPTGDTTAGRILSEASSRHLLGTSKPQGSSLNRLVPALLSSQRGSRALQGRLAQADAWAYAQDLITQSITGDGCGQLPLHPTADWLNWIWVDGDADRPVLTAPAVQRLQMQGITTLISDGLMPLPLLEKALQDAPHIFFQWIGGSQGVHPVVTHLLQDHLPKISGCIFYQHPAQARQWSPILAKNGIPHLHIYGKTPQAQAFALDYLLRSRS